MTTLVRFEAARQALQEARTLDEVKDIRDKAEALRLYCKQVGESLEMQNAVADIKIRAERKAGKLLAEMDLKAGRPPDNGNTLLPLSPPTLSDLGIDKMQSSRWQQIATVPEPVFEQHIAEKKGERAIPPHS